MKKFTADFETVTWLDNETYVWAWATCEIGNNENIRIGTRIEEFIEYCFKNKNSTWYFHNLKFDGEFIIYYLLKNGYKHVEKKQDIEDKTFTTLISNMGQFYQITIYFNKKNKNVVKATFIDSLKIIPFSVDEIAKGFNLPISKLTIDYNKPREKGYLLNDEERNYIKNDVLIMAMALEYLFNENLEKMTIGSNALSDFKKLITKSKFTRLFPNLDYEIDQDLRRSYRRRVYIFKPYLQRKGREKYNGIRRKQSIPFPVSVMFEKKLPFGEPIYFEGKYQEDKIYNLYIQMITCSFKLKKNKIPTIQLKNNINFRSNEYLESSNGKIVCLVLTSVDLKLFFEQYDIKDLTYIGGWKFKSIHGIFSDYINKWITRKNESTITGNKPQRQIAKLMLNSLYRKICHFIRNTK